MSIFDPRRIFFALLMPLVVTSLTSQAAVAPISINEWRNQVAETRLLAENNTSAAYREAKKLEGLLPADADAIDHAKILNLLSRIETYLALSEQALAHAQQALTVATRRSDRLGMAEAELNIAFEALNQGKIDSMAAATIHSQNLLRDGDPPGLLAESRLRVAVMYRRLGKLDDSISLAVQAMEDAKKKNSPLMLAYAHQTLGILYVQSNRFNEALNHFSQMRVQARYAQSKLLEALAMMGISQAQRNVGNVHNSEEILDQSIDLCKEIDSPLCLTLALVNLAENLRAQGRYAEALPLFNETEALYTEHPNKIGYWWVLNYRSLSYQSLGEFEKSLADAKHAYDLAKEIAFPLYINSSTKRLSEIYASKNDFRQAYAYAIETIDTARQEANEFSGTRIVELAKRYETENKQRQIDELTHRAQLQNAATQQRWLWTILIGSSLALVGVTYFMLRLRRSRQEIGRLNANLEQRVEERTAELLQREQEYRTLAENSPNFIVRYDLGCRHTYMNPAFERLIGLTAPESLGRTPRELPSRSLGDDLQESVLQAIQGGLSTEISLAGQDADGHSKWANVHLVPERGPAGNVISVLGIGHDTTERTLRGQQEEIRLNIFELLAHGGELGEILTLVVKYVETSHPDLICAILLLNKDRTALHLGSAPNLPGIYGERALTKYAPANTTETLTQPASATNASMDESMSEHGLQTCWSEPILNANGESLGTLVTYRQGKKLPFGDMLSLIRQASHLAAIAIERKRIEERMHQQASYDTLTGLPNRRLFNDRLVEEIAKANRSRHHVALLFIDLDRFKEVNDTLGHEVGDKLLINAAQRIRQSVRESDTVARLGGDEFVVIIPDIARYEYLSRVAQMIIDDVSLPFAIDAHTAYVSASIGIASYPLDADNAESLISCADQAMYAAKEKGRNGFSFFTNSMQESMLYRMRLATDLRDALALGQLQAFFQPIVDVATGKIVKAEALLRWKHPEFGMVSPQEFIPIAEDIGAIHEIGDWIFRQSAHMALNWKRARFSREITGIPCQISVNLSPRQFVRSNISETWISHLASIGLPTECIVVEITEGLLLSDQSDVVGKLRKFRDAGMEVALDDFGTGYSAMAYLKRFNIDYLKIDRSFVRDLETDLNDRAIAEAIVVMAHKLGLKVIAEGVETDEQCALLTAVGCEFIQGYLYAKPMPAHEFLDFVAAADAAEATVSSLEAL